MKKYMYKGKVISKRQADLIVAKSIGKFGLTILLMYLFIVGLTVLE